MALFPVTPNYQNHPISITSWHCTKNSWTYQACFWHLLSSAYSTLLDGNLVISDIKGTFLWNIHRNSGIRKFCNCTLILSGAVSLGGWSVWWTGDGHQFMTLDRPRVQHGVRQRITQACQQKLVLRDVINFYFDYCWSGIRKGAWTVHMYYRDTKDCVET